MQKLKIDVRAGRTLCLPLLIVTLGLVGGCNRSEPEPTGPPVVTREEADKIRVGMTLDEAQKIVGDPGKPIGEPEAGSTATYHSWKNPDGTLLTVTLNNGKVQRVNPVNLK